MSTRAIQFFMVPDEFATLIKQLARTLGLHIVLARPGRPPRVELATHELPLTMSDRAPARWLFLTAEAPTLQQVSSQTLRPAEWGWVDADVPEVVGDTLYLAQMAAKTDWLDNGQVRHNRASAVLLRQLLPALRGQLKHPVWAYNVRGGAVQVYNDLWYSEGAAQFAHSGGQLRQRDVAYVRFSLDAPASM